METVLIILGILQTLALISYVSVVIWAVRVLISESRTEPPKPHKPLFKPKEPKETEEEKRLRILSENIENYDGSAKGQIKL
jgi:hypothetical protein